MPSLYIIKELSSKHGTSLKALAKQVGISEVGLQRIIKKNTTSVGTLEKIADILDVPVSVFFKQTEGLIIVADYIFNPLAIMLRNRLDKLTDKLSLMKDYYVWEVLSHVEKGVSPFYPILYSNCPAVSPEIFHKIENGKVPPYVKRYPHMFESDVLEKLSTYIKHHPKIVETPFNKMEKSFIELLTSNKFFLQTFYDTIFFFNALNINDYLNDDLIKDEEMIKYWNKWKIAEPNIVALAGKLPSHLNHQF